VVIVLRAREVGARVFEVPMRQGECRAGVAESSGGLLWDNRDQGERARETRGTHPALPITHLRSPGSPARAAGGRERNVCLFFCHDSTFLHRSVRPP
jgi:hypothetical protein